jgi:uncharacterized repeat protein (TIGR01451 family)
VPGNADLSITKSASPNPAITGEELIYTITVTNAGPATAMNVLIADAIAVLPSPQFTTDLINGPWIPWSSPYNAGNLASGNFVTIYIRGIVPVNQCVAIDNTATVSSNTPDDNSANNEVNITTPVTDNQSPTFTAPGPFSFCVEDIIEAVVSGLPYPDDLTYPRPDYYQFVNGDTDFNLTVSSFSDNCCTPAEDDITWKIETLSGDPVANGTGQPSTHADFKIPGNNLTEVVYRITWWIKDCHDQLSAPITRDITILPRPFIELQY